MQKKEYQVTIINPDGKYKPVSCIVTREQNSDYDLSRLDKKIRNEIAAAGTQKICNKHYWNKSDLLKYGYTQVKVRLYDKEKIAAENAERYARIKEEKYASGEWKRPKNS